MVHASSKGLTLSEFSSITQLPWAPPTLWLPTIGRPVQTYSLILAKASWAQEAKKRILSKNACDSEYAKAAWIVIEVGNSLVLDALAVLLWTGTINIFYYCCKIENNGTSFNLILGSVMHLEDTVCCICYSTISLLRSALLSKFSFSLYACFVQLALYDLFRKNSTCFCTHS